MQGAVLDMSDLERVDFSWTRGRCSRLWIASCSNFQPHRWLLASGETPPDVFPEHPLVRPSEI